MEDCVNGEDEDVEHCATQDGIYHDKAKIERKGRKVEPRMYTIDNLAGQAYKINNQDSLNNRTVIVIFLSTLAICVGLCLVIIFALIRSRRRPTTEKSVPALEQQVSTGSANTYVLQANSPNPIRKHNWSLKTCTIEKELGSGFFSKVYLVKDSEKCPFALKTVDKPSNLIAEEGITNEIDILSRIEDHFNILKLIGSNMDIIIQTLLCK